MKKRMKILATCLVIAVGGQPMLAAAQSACVTSENVTPIATNLNNPRGLKFGPDGSLYVAEGGTGGTQMDAICDPLQPGPPGPYSGGFDSGILRIAINGDVTEVVSGQPSTQNQPGFVSGVADVGFIGNTLYGLIGGGGCTHGLAGTYNGVFRVDGNATNQVANLGAYSLSDGVPHPPDYEAEGTWYSMVAVRGDLYAVEPNHGEIVRVSPDGTVTRVTGLTARYGHIVPTAIAYDGNFYVGTLGTFATGFAAMVIKVTPSGQTSVVVEGLKSITGLVVDRGSIYILENAGGFVAPCTGQIVRASRSGRIDPEPIATGLTFPTAMTLGPDGNLYVSDFGYFFGDGGVGGGAGIGEVVRVDLH